VRRHEPLRTTFALIDGEPVQIVQAPKRLELPLVDLTGMDAGHQVDEIARCCKEEADRPFDLNSDLMLRASLLRLGEGEHVLLVTMHHIASDGWSFRLMCREMDTLYEAFCHGARPDLPELPIQYADYAVWQQNELQGQRLDDLVQFWRDCVQDAAGLELPADHPRPAAPSYRGAEHVFEIPQELVAQLNALSQRAGVSLHMTLLAAFQALLSRYSGQDDIAVGVPAAGRNHAALERLVGFFVNTLVLRTDLSGDPTFRELLNRVRETSLGAYDHQDLPFEKLVEAVKPERDLGKSPVVQVLFQLVNFPEQELSLTGLEITRLPSGSQRVRFDLELHLRQQANIIRGTVVYSTDLFEKATIERMASHFLTLLGGVVADAEQRISDLPLLTVAERHHLLFEWNDTAVKYPLEKCVHELFEEQVEATPDAVAVIFEDRQITYRESNERANQLARHLRGLGVEPDSLVGLCLERSPELVIGILGILKAGGAYVPFDLDYPTLRLGLMLADANPRCFVTKRDLLGRLPAAGCELVCLDRDSTRLQELASSNLPVIAGPASLAYVMHTSGSTGVPKGVAMPHAALVNLIAWHQKDPRLARPARTLQFASCNFDVSFQEMLTTWCSGGTLILIPEATRRDPTALWKVIVETGVERIFMPYVALQQLATTAGTQEQADDMFPESRPSLREGTFLRGAKGDNDSQPDPDCAQSENCAEVGQAFQPDVRLESPTYNRGTPAVAAKSARLRDIISAGEVLKLTPEIRRLLKRHSHCRLHNHYGPTESHVVTSLLLDTEQQTWPAEAPIGRPIANAQISVLDARRRPVPIGIPGEIHIGGVCLARGYLNRPDLTAERFVPNPFSDDPDARLYRTGDRGRWRGDGNLEFLGRLDDQVKLRGFRVELGEIESVLEEHPAVAQSVVSLREDAAGEPRLVAYCVGGANASLNFSELHGHLSSRLPGYMLPAAFVALEALPLTPSGKVNRRALPDPDQTRAEWAGNFVGARNPIEEQIAHIWCDLLGIERVGVHDNFFALGGHSLLATRVNARVAAVLHVDLPLRKLFEFPTIAAFSAEIGLVRRRGGAASSKPLTRLDRKERDGLRLSFAQERLWFLEQMEGALTAYNLSRAWKLAGPLNVEALRRALEAIVRRHEALRTTFALDDGEPVQVVRAMERLELREVELDGQTPIQQAEEIARFSKAEADLPFDLIRDPMLRASLLRLDEDEHVLLLTMHHIACDGWSLSVLWEELERLYAGYCGGSDPDLVELPLQYADFAVWQRNELQGQRLERMVQYWTKQLDGVRALEHPTDRPYPSSQSYRGARHGFALPEVLVEEMKSLGQREGVTVHMTLLAAFQSLLARYSSQEDIAVGMPVAGRSHAALEGMIGFFVNTLVLRTDLSGDPTFRELLGRVREVSLGAYDHQDLPFEKLVEELKPERDFSRSPLVQVLFQVLCFAEKGLSLAGLEATRLPSCGQRVRFDLEMHLWQQAKKIEGEVVYSTDLFDAATIERMTGHFLTLLQAVTADADKRLSDLPLLTAAERHQLLSEWNDTAVEYPRDRCLHELFEEQVQKTPDAVALMFGACSLTYAELNSKANRLAHYLRSLGIGPEALVGLLVERSPEMVTGLLGTLKAGGAYLPLDLDYPAERLVRLVEDARPAVILAQEHLLAHFPIRDARVLCLDRDWGDIAGHMDSDPESGVTPDNVAYVIYTSGSTGVPKGVMNTHAGVVNRLQWMQQAFPLSGIDRVLQKTPFSFDVSVWEFFWPLLTGARMVLARPGGHREPSYLARVIEERGITIIHFVPSMLQAFLEEPRLEGRCRTLRHVFASGEALPESVARRCLERLPCRLHNLYGPTEAAIDVTHWECRRDDPPGAVPIGKPIANMRAYILDGRGEPLPVGVPGELYLGGVGVARGYLNRPELTAERFVPDPFERRPGARLYRTGDRVRWRADGNIEFLRRLDDQVKLRGFRIELGEIEAALCRHPVIEQAAVLLREDRAGDKRLVAYVVVRGDGVAPEDRELREFLARSLPDHMVPSAFVSLASLPLNANGKLDRKALPPPGAVRLGADEGSVAPRNQVEQALATVWEEVLGIAPVSIRDDFFELGGHSLLAVRLIARIEDALGVRLPISTVLQGDTIECLAKAVEERRQLLRFPAPVRGRRVHDRVVTLQPQGERPPVFMVPGDSDHVWSFRHLALAIGNEWPLHGLQPNDLDLGVLPYRSLEELARDLVEDIRSVAGAGPYYLLGFSAGGLIAYEIAQQLRASGGQVRLLALLDTYGPGYPRLLPMHTRLIRHFRNLRHLDGAEARRYAIDRTQAVLRRLQQPFQLSRGCTANGPEQPSMGDQIDHSCWRDLKNRYCPSIYTGRVDLFAAERPDWIGSDFSDATMGWGKLVKGGLNVHRIQGQHLQMIKPPCVNELATKIRQCLRINNAE
jgi:amino acid adenylation domain-containing protein